MAFIISKLGKAYRNARISQKLFLVFSAVIVIPAILVSILFIHFKEDQLYREAMVRGSSHVAALEEQLRARLSMIENASYTILTQSSFIEFIHSNMITDGLQLVKFRQSHFEQMQYLIQSHEMVSSISFYVDNDDIYEIWPEIYHYDRFSPQSYGITLRDQGGAAFRLFSFHNGDSILSYYRTVRLQGEQNKLPTILEVRAEHQLLFDHFIENSEGEFFTIVVDGSNYSRSIYNAKHQFVQYSKEHFNDIIKMTHSELDVLQQNSPLKINVNDQSYYVIYRYIAPLDAYIINIAAHEILMEGPRSWYGIIIATTLCVMMLIMLSISYTTQRILRRLNAVLDSMRRIRTGDFDAKIDVGLEPHESGDEIDEVAISYNNMLDEMKQLMTQVVDKQLIAKNAQLHSLHSQINSHFLYNALEAIRMRAEMQQQQEIANALVALGSQLRYSMQWRSDTVTLDEELANIRSYLSFMSFMEQRTITLDANLPHDVLAYTIPKMCLQPIIENTVHHAAPQGQVLSIHISVEIEQEQYLLISITDNGVGIDASLLAQLQAALLGRNDTPIVTTKNGLGLENVHKRLQLHYGSPCGLTIESVQGMYTTVTLRLPWEFEHLGGW